MKHCAQKKTFAKSNTSEVEVRTKIIDKILGKVHLTAMESLWLLVVLLVINFHQCWQKHMNYFQLGFRNQRDYQCLGRSYYKKLSVLKNLAMTGVC